MPPEQTPAHWQLRWKRNDGSTATHEFATAELAVQHLKRRLPAYKDVMQHGYSRQIELRYVPEHVLGEVQT